MPSPDIIIAGFGLPGRSVATALDSQGCAYCIIEMNPETVSRCLVAGVPIIAGDAGDPEVLERAGIKAARLLVVAVPNEEASLGIVRMAKSLNPKVHIIARCVFTSGGLQALQSGADEVVIAEQVVAEHLRRAVLESQARERRTDADKPA